MEETFALDSGDGFTIYGRVTHPQAGVGARAVVLCHGLAGHMNEHLFQTGKRYFNSFGYDVIRFNFYGEEENARQIADCDVSIHAKDINMVLMHFAPMYDRIYVAGHSYGGLAIIKANPEKAAAASLWDASFSAYRENPLWEKHWVLDEERDTAYITWPPMSYVVGKKLYLERQKFTRDYLTDRASDVTLPTQVLAAGAYSENIPNQKELFDRLGSEHKEFYLIADAGHCFYEGDTVFDLLEKSRQWFERF